MKNSIAKLLRTIAWFSYVLGTLGAVILFVTDSFSMGLIFWGSIILLGSIVLGLSEIIHLLQLGFSETVELMEEGKKGQEGKQ